MSEKIILPPRLKAVLDMVPVCNTAADIGTDHAYIPLELVINNTVKTAIAADVVKGPLEIAEDNILRFNMSDKITTVLSDGLLCVPQTDVYIIAGMGGKLICDILAAGEEKAKKAKLLVLQPMTGQYELRKFLHENGYKIVNEALAKEEHRVYNIITAVCGNESYDKEIYYHIGKKNVENKNPLLTEYVKIKVRSLTERIDNMANSSNTGVVLMREELIKLREEFLNYGKGF